MPSSDFHFLMSHPNLVYHIRPLDFFGKMSRRNTPQKFGLPSLFTALSISKFVSGLSGKTTPSTEIFLLVFCITIFIIFM